MKKKLFFLAMATFVAMSNTSCGSDSNDEGGNNNTPVTLPKPVYADEAVAFTLQKDNVSDKFVSLTGLNITESGKAVIEVTTDEGKKKFVSYDVKIEGDTYTISKNGKTMGKVINTTSMPKAAPTRASSSVNLVINLSVEIPFLGTFTFMTTNPVVAQKVVQTITSTVNTTNIARTWKVQEMKLTCVGDVDFSITEKSGNLEVFVKEAQDRGANLTKVEEAELSRTIYGITLDKTGMFSIEYGDGTTEVCSWQWTSANQEQLMLKLRDSEFGNKFLSNKSNIGVKFYAGGCTFTLTTNIVGSKNYKATLVIVMK